MTITRVVLQRTHVYLEQLAGDIRIINNLFELTELNTIEALYLTNNSPARLYASGNTFIGGNTALHANSYINNYFTLVEIIDNDFINLKVSSLYVYGNNATIENNRVFIIFILLFLFI